MSGEPGGRRRRGRGARRGGAWGASALRRWEANGRPEVVRALGQTWESRPQAQGRRKAGSLVRQAGTRWTEPTVSHSPGQADELHNQGEEGLSSLGATQRGRQPETGRASPHPYCPSQVCRVPPP